MGRFVQLPIILASTAAGYDRILEEFIFTAGSRSFTDVEINATNKFLKALRAKPSLFDKIAWLHPYIGNTALSRSLNLMNAKTHAITFSGNVSHEEAGTIYNSGTGVVDLTEGKPTNTDIAITLFVRNNVTGNFYDFAQVVRNVNALQSFHINYPGLGCVFDCGNYSTGRLQVNASLTGSVTANINPDVGMSIWNSAALKGSKTSGYVEVEIPTYAYNPNSAGNTRQYGMACVSKGLSSQEVIDLHEAVNTYMWSLGRGAQ